jgi:ABC-type uncharacterized transport system substrate-binding protein
MRSMMRNKAEPHRGSSGAMPRRGYLAEPLIYGRPSSLILRYTFIVSVTIGLVAASFLEAAQTPQQVFRIGLLAEGARTADGAPPGPLRQALRELGYVEGQNVEYESRFAEGRIERLSGMAAELVKLNVDVIVVLGGQAAAAAKRTTSSIPIVIGAAAGDAVALGWIASLPHPGGNVTGLTDESVQLSSKRMQLLKEAVPKAALIAVLWNANDQGMTLRYREIEKAAQTLHVDVEAFGVNKPDDFAVAFSAMTLRRPDALFLVADPMTSTNRKRVIDFAATQRIPAMYEYGFIVREGGLMSYGTSFEDSFRIAAFYIDRILKGAKPAELPAEQPTRYYLTVNLKTAAALGMTLPPSLLMADQVIE